MEAHGPYRCVPSRVAPRLLLLGHFGIQENPFGGTVEIVVLAASQRPEEGEQADAAEEEGHGNEVDERGRAASGTTSTRGMSVSTSLAETLLDLPAPRRSALAITSTDDADMAIAAISGVA